MTAGNADRAGLAGHASTVLARRRRARIRIWTRKLHNYLGLYFLVFLWLFAVSGLVLNHSTWSLAQFWKARAESTAERQIVGPAVTDDAAIAADLMRQLGIGGEVNETRRSPRGERFDFQVVKPGRVFRVEARLDSSKARVTTTRLNAWGAVDALHKFTGVKLGDPAQTRDWLLTKIWSFAMDALALGLVILVASGLYLWLRLADRRGPGLVALALGAACAAFFVYGLGALIA